MSFRGTENYIYDTEHTLGSGSTASVYFGRHKRMGDPCAVKIFTNQASEKRKQIMLNELEYMRKLEHKNIVKFLAIEKDSKTENTALIMELCTDGSMQKLLSKSKYLYGLTEHLLVDFIGQLANGLHYLRLHGIGHRDVKPGNILCTTEEDGRLAFKLTDFGASRELLLENASKTALYGTEEYLHPAVYDSVFISKKRLDEEYETCSELWSIGATIYHITTGQLPFQVHGGRQNKDQMYKLLHGKPTGAISGIQKHAGGEFTYSRTLPKNCFLSGGAVKSILPLFIGLLENNPRKQMNFDRFFPTCTEISRNILFVVHNVVRCCFHHCYVPHDTTYDRLVVKLLEQIVDECPGWSVKQEDLILFHGDRLLSEVVGKMNDIKTFPTTSMENPIILLPVATVEDGPQPMLATLPGFPRAEGDDKTSDATWSREVAAYSWQAVAVVKSLECMQSSIIRAYFCLVNSISTRRVVAEALLISLERTVVKVEETLQMVGLRVVQVIELLGQFSESSGEKKGKILKALTPGGSAKESDIKSTSGHFRKKLNEILSNLCKVMDDKLSKDFVSKILNNIQKFNVKQPPNVPPDPSCKSERCVNKMEIHFERSSQVQAQFEDDKNNSSLTYNQDQLHKFEKVKLEDRVKGVTNTVYKHCWTSTTQTRDTFLKWYRESMQLKIAELESFELEATRINLLCIEVQSVLEKLNDLCKHYDNYMKTSQSDSDTKTLLDECRKSCVTLDGKMSYLEKISVAKSIDTSRVTTSSPYSGESFTSSSMLSRSSTASASSSGTIVKSGLMLSSSRSSLTISPSEDPEIELRELQAPINSLSDSQEGFKHQLLLQNERLLNCIKREGSEKDESLEQVSKMLQIRA